MPDSISVTGIILAGGKSRRFGENKALSIFRGERLIERLIRSVREITDELLIVTNTPDDFAFLDLPMVGDLIPDCGSLGGIYTGLKTMQTRYGLCIACDMPFVQPAFIRYMVEFTNDSYDVIVPRSDHAFDLMCAVYGTACVTPIEEKLSSGDLKITRFYDQVRVKTITAEDTDLFTPRMLFNVNTQTDYEAALRLLEDGGNTN